MNTGNNKTKTEQIKAIKKGRGVQFILDKAYTILGNPINIFDTDYNLIAYTDVLLDDSLWNELITTGTFCSESQMFFMKECFTDYVANAKKIAIMKSDKLKHDRILGHIYNGHGIKVANVLMVECNEAFEPDMLTAFETLVDVLSREIRDEEFFITYGEAYQDAWIKRLIDYDIEEKGLYSPHVQILYDGFKANLYLAVVDIAQSDAQPNGLKYFVDLFRQKRKDFKYAIYDKHIVVIMSTDYQVFDIKRELSGFVGYFKQKNIYAGVSRCFDNLFDLHRYYSQAVEALNKGISAGGAQRIFLYEDNTDL